MRSSFFGGHASDKTGNGGAAKSLIPLEGGTAVTGEQKTERSTGYKKILDFRCASTPRNTLARRDFLLSARLTNVGRVRLLPKTGEQKNGQPQ
jgi:hypothetical protein